MNCPVDESEIIEDDDNDEPLPGGGRPFPVLLVACAVAFVVLAFTAVYIGIQVWLANNIHVAPNGLAARYQCRGVAFSLKISSLQSELDITVPDDRKDCGAA